LVTYITTWSPAAWGYAETVVLFAAVIIGGAGNHLGAILGAILVPVGFEEITRFIPTSNNLPPNLIPSLQWVAIGLLIVVFLWVRPQGILPERKRVIRLPGSASTGRASAGSASTGRASAGLPFDASAETEARSRGPVDGVRRRLYARYSPRPSSPQASDGEGSATPSPRVPDEGSASPSGRPPSPRASDGDGSASPAGVGAEGERAASASGAASLRSPGSEVVIEAVDVVREFGGVRAVDGVSFQVRRGTLTGLIGPNGAGKSTLLAMLAGTLPVTSGKILYEGRDITRVAAYRRARVGLVRTFQLASEFKRLTVMENLLSAVRGNRGDTFRGSLLGKRYWQGDETAAIVRADAILQRFGLEQFANHYAGELSGGQRRLVEIMRALMTEPTALLLDEPMAGVHPNLARRIGNELVALCEEGMTILMVEHELAIMDEFCDPVVVMAEGAVLAEGTMAQLRQRSEVVEAYLVG
ncbi:MAG TPA: ATP-binding cassette domain-containing protein, partial [Streptosporangiaceae bacterium]|nr:ATP-binding cassette domain-containing protein [Streptosporangiaceae bacterium]